MDESPLPKPKFKLDDLRKLGVCHGTLVEATLFDGIEVKSHEGISTIPIASAKHSCSQYGDVVRDLPGNKCVGYVSLRNQEYFNLAPGWNERTNRPEANDLKICSIYYDSIFSLRKL